MENSSSVASASSEAGSSRSQEIEELERFIDSYVLEYQVQGLLGDKADGETDGGDGGVKASQWTEEYKRDGSWSSSRGRGSSKPDEWDHSSNGSTGSRPSCGSRPGSGSRSGSRGRNNQFTAPAKNGTREGSLDILGTDIWAANTMDSHGPSRPCLMRLRSRTPKSSSDEEGTTDELLIRLAGTRSPYCCLQARGDSAKFQQPGQYPHHHHHHLLHLLHPSARPPSRLSLSLPSCERHSRLAKTSA
ncbi:unnamed protein product [Boreogadus saida]